MSTTQFVAAPAGEVRFALAPTAFGDFTVVGDDAALISVSFPGAEPPADGSWGSPVDLADHRVLRAAATQLAEFFAGSGAALTCPCGLAAPSSSRPPGPHCSRFRMARPAPMASRPGSWAGQVPRVRLAAPTTATRSR